VSELRRYLDARHVTWTSFGIRLVDGRGVAAWRGWRLALGLLVLGLASAVFGLLAARDTARAAQPVTTVEPGAPGRERVELRTRSSRTYERRAAA